MAKAKDYTPPTRAELEAMRESKVLGAPASEAVRREISFLRNVGGAGDDLEWILFNQAWTELGFENVGDWWEQRVLPVLVNVDMRPSASLADRVMAAIAADEAGLPKLQRRTQRQIAALARTSQARVSRSRSDANESGSDLEKAAKPASSPLVEALRTEIESVEDKQKNTTHDPAVPSTEDTTDGGGPTANSGTTPAAGSGAQTHEGEADRLGPAVTPTEGHRGLTLGETDDAGPSSGTTDSATEQRPSSIPLPAEQVEVQAPAGVTAPAPPNPEELEERTDEQDDEVLPPLPHAGDPAALIAWFADRFDQVDPDVTGPLLPSDDLALIAASLDRIVFVVDRLTDWHERAQR
jgi:hypothetical protein